ncbi:MAG: hypothetical protein R3E62_09970 [Pseudomonadales bacterium]
MNPFYYLFLPLLALPLLLFMVNKWVLKRRLQPQWLMLINFALTYLIILVGSQLIEYRLENDLKAFDLNNDGVFSGAEVTPQQQAAARELERISARTLAPAIGFIFAFFYSALFYTVLIAANKIREKSDPT